MQESPHPAWSLTDGPVDFSIFRIGKLPIDKNSSFHSWIALPIFSNFTETFFYFPGRKKHSENNIFDNVGLGGGCKCGIGSLLTLEEDGAHNFLGC